MYDRTVVRDESVDGISRWLWPQDDHGAWTGPKDDWEQSHKDKILKYVNNFDIVVQAGGNCGMYPRLLSDMFKVVYTFEPEPLNFFCLVNNCQKSNIIKLNAALGDKHSMIRVLLHDNSNVGMHTVEENETCFIPQLMIDDLHLFKCDLIMLDIEGYEIHALKGAEKTIKNFKPVIFCERPTDNIMEYLSGFGYSPVDISKMDTIFIVK